jgi:5-methylcytosine-specific restriction endonuclease McrA
MPVARRLTPEWRIFERDEFTCIYCGRSPAKGDNCVLVVDHVDPVIDGGSNEASNLVTACYVCNKGKKATRIRSERRALILATIATRNAAAGIRPDAILSRRRTTK